LCNWVGALYLSNQVTQCCSILPTDAENRGEWIDFYGEQSGAFKGLDLICRVFCALKPGLKPGHWFCFWGTLGAKRTSAEERVGSEPSQRLLQDLRSVANAQSSLKEGKSTSLI